MMRNSAASEEYAVFSIWRMMMLAPTMNRMITMSQPIIFLKREPRGCAMEGLGFNVSGRLKIEQQGEKVNTGRASERDSGADFQNPNARNTGTGRNDKTLPRWEAQQIGRAHVLNSSHGY